MKVNGKFDWKDKEALIKLVETAISRSQILRTMGLNPPSNMRTLNKYVKRYQIDTSHFDPVLDRTKCSLEDVLVENSSYVNITRLKKRLVREGILEYKCAECSNEGSWLSKPLSLQLEHKNGIHDDHSKENLCFLCPNCHSQTSTYGGRNSGMKK